MKANKDLSDMEFAVSLDIKRAINALGHNNFEDAKNHLYSALANLHH